MATVAAPMTAITIVITVMRPYLSPTCPVPHPLMSGICLIFMYDEFLEPTP